MKKSIIGILCAGICLLISCNIASLFSGDTQGLLEEVTVHIVIDDAVIEAGDAYEVIDPVWWTANIYGSWQEYENSLKGFSQEQRYLVANTWHEAEVFNGGHDQFYWDSTGIV